MKDEILSIDYVNTETKSVDDEYRKFLALTRSGYSRDEYTQFRENLHEYWKTVDLRELGAEWEVTKADLRFYSEGLTGALVFRAGVHTAGNDSEQFIRVMKYDEVDKIRDEVKKYRHTGARSDAKIFPSLHAGEDMNGRAFVAMRSVIDSNRAVKAHTLIRYLLMKYRGNRTYLNLYGDRIGEALSKVNSALGDDFYFRELARGVYNGMTIGDCMRSKAGFDVLQDKTGGTFGETYDRCAGIIRSALDAAGTEVPDAASFLDIQADAPAILSTHAIHKDYNVNNTLMAIDVSGREEVVEPMLIDFAEVNFREPPGMIENCGNWVPLLYDAARLESEIIIRFFDACLVENNGPAAEIAIEFDSLWEVAGCFLETLDRGIFTDLRSPVPEIISDGSINYLFRILFAFRSSVFGPLIEEGLCDAECIMANYRWCMTAFNYFYLKFSSEERIAEKKPLALAMAALFRQKLINGEMFEAVRPYRAIPMQEMDLSPFTGLITELSGRYIAHDDEISRILDFAESEEYCHLLVQGNPGTGKTSLTAFLTRLLNGDLIVPDLQDREVVTQGKCACIPWFIRQEEEGTVPIEWIGRQIVRLMPSLGGIMEPDVPEYGGAGLSPEGQQSGTKKLKDRFSELLRSADYLLAGQGRRLVIVIDGLDNRPSSIEEIVVNERFTRISFIYLSRPDLRSRDVLLSLFGVAEPVELAFFGPDDLELYLRRRGINVGHEGQERLFRLSKGYQIYVDRLCGIMEREGSGILERLETKEESAGGLDGLYREIVRSRIKGNTGAREVALFLALAREPLHRDQLTALMEPVHGDDATDIASEGIEVCVPVLRYTETGRMEIFHRTAADYLLREYPALMPGIRERFALYLVNTIEDAAGKQEMDTHRRYAAAHAGVHLYGWGMDEELVRIISYVFDDTNEYAKEYDSILENMVMDVIPRESKPGESRLAELLNTIAAAGGYRLEDVSSSLSWNIFHTVYYTWAIKLNLVAIKICETLYRSNSGNVFIAYRLATYYRNLGYLFNNEGRKEEAERYCQRALEITETLNKSNPDIVDIPNSLALIYSSLGSIYYSEGRREEAERYYLRAVEIEELLYKSNPGHITIANGLAAIYRNLGSLCGDESQREEVERYYHKAIDICETLYRSYPDNVNVASGLASIYGGLGFIYLYEDRREEAERYYHRSIEICETLYMSNPGRIDIANELATKYGSLGTLYYNQVRGAEAEWNYLRAVEIREPLYKSNPGHVAIANGLAVTYGSIGLLYQDEERREEAVRYYQRAIEISEQLYASNPNLVAVANGLARLYGNLGSLYQEEGLREEVERNYLRAIEIREMLYRSNPDHVIIADGLATNYGNLGSLYTDGSQFVEAENMFQRACEIYSDMANKKIIPFSSLPFFAYICRSLSNVILENNITEERRKRAVELLVKSYQINNSLGNNEGINACRNALRQLGVDPDGIGPAG